MNIRRWKYTDIAPLEKFQLEAGFPDRWNYNILAQSFLSDRFFGLLAEENGEIAGMAAIGFNLDEADLEIVLVAKERRRQGLGGALMDALMAECAARELKKLFLEVRESNLPAVSLYKKYGFEKISQRKKYYGDGENADVMLKEF